MDDCSAGPDLDLLDEAFNGGILLKAARAAVSKILRENEASEG